MERRWFLPTKDEDLIAWAEWDDEIHYSISVETRDGERIFDIDHDPRYEREREWDPLVKYLTTVYDLMIVSASVIDWPKVSPSVRLELHLAPSLDFVAKQHHDTNECMVAEALRSVA